MEVEIYSKERTIVNMSKRELLEEVTLNKWDEDVVEYVHSIIDKDLYDNYVDSVLVGVNENDNLIFQPLSSSFNNKEQEIKRIERDLQMSLEQVSR